MTCIFVRMLETQIRFNFSPRLLAKWPNSFALPALPFLKSISMNWNPTGPKFMRPSDLNTASLAEKNRAKHSVLSRLTLNFLSSFGRKILAIVLSGNRLSRLIRLSKTISVPMPSTFTIFFLWSVKHFRAALAKPCYRTLLYIQKRNK